MKNTQLTRIVFALLFPFALNAQMQINGDTLYGNEWIDYSQNYVKVSVIEDGIHRLSYQDLNDAGVFSGGNTPQGMNFQLYYYGQEVPIHVSTNGTLGNSDYIDFHGLKNLGDLDKHLYLEPEFHLNPMNSIFTDTSAYFLTWNTSSSNLRFNQVAYDPSNLPPAENYCLDTEIVEYHNKWQKGERHGASDARECAYDNVEGFCATNVVSQTTNLNTPNVYSSGPSSIVEAQFVTEAGSHDITIDVEGTNYISESFTNWEVKNYGFDIPSNSISGNTTSVVIAGNNSSDDKVGVAFVKIEYPRTFDFGNAATFYFALDAGNNKKYIEVNGFDHGGTAPVLYDITNNLRIATNLSGTTVLAVLPFSSVKRDLVLVSAADYKTAANVQPSMNFIDFESEESNYVIVSNELLYGNGSEPNYVENYANYRRSSAGGNYAVTLAEIHQVYDQFAYGINRHEMSLKNFTHKLIEAGNIEYLFLIGDGRSFNGMRASFQGEYRLPTFGHPTSDHMIASDIGSYIPKIPVGRLAAHNPHHVDLYLRKVMAFEGNVNLPQTVEDKAWMKRIVHLGGGDAGIQNTIRGQLEAARTIIEDGTFGGKVHSFFKTSTDVIQDAPAEQLEYLINDGVTMVTFFGHSAPSTLDFNLEDPTYYQNEGKYPLVYAIGCNNNRIMEYNGTLGEEWVLTEHKGAIAFFGATWQTTLSNLSAYAIDFYENFSTDNYGESIGDIIVETIKDFSLSEAFYANQLKQVMILHGDPALKLNPHQGPDLLVDKSSVSISPALLNTQMEDFKFNFSVANIGSDVLDSMEISIYHEKPDGQIDSVTVLRHDTPGFNTALEVTVPLSSTNNLVGFNKLLVQIDPRDSISEMPNPVGEMNNGYTYPFYVIANDAFPVYPYEYSIVNTPTPTLKASTANAFANSQKYFFEIDTTQYFDSPIKQATSMTETGGLLEWEPSIPYIDNTVYYWRIAVDSTETTGFGFNWHESSFVYIDDSSPGWNQSHFHQLKKDNQLEGIVLEEPNRQLRFNEQINEIVMKNAPLPLTSIYEVGPIFNGGTIQRLYSCTNSGVHVVVFDSATLEAWSNPVGGTQNSYNCNPTEIFSFPFKTTDITEREFLIDFLENIPDDNYVAVFSVQKTLTAGYSPEDWALDSLSNNSQTNIFQVLESQGATKVRQLEDLGSVPYFFLYQKNNPDFLAEQNYTTEVIADTIAANIEGTYYISVPQDEGKLTSVKIGPATEWTSLHWNQTNYLDGIDKTALKIYGINQDENKVLLHENIWALDTTLSHINAQEYPFLQLEYDIKDSLELSAANLDFWRVNYQPVPEAALRPDLNFVFNSDTINQGEQLTVEIAVENISEIDMDSLLVHYTVIDQNNNTVLEDDRMAPLVSGDTLNAYLSFDTRNVSTPNNLLIVDVNPDNDQLEQTHFNNVAVKQFFIETDVRNPLIDVTFDGVHILDGDIVSAKPLINVILNDENKYLALNDTSLFRVSLKHPEENDYREISFDNETVTFIPATEGDLEDGNKAKIEIRDYYQVDGIYELRISAKDRSGNDAGEYDYKIRFEVINEAKVSNVLNYPNPFSTSTQFVFTLTGSEVPDFMKIQIMTVSGRIVKEITQSELGMIHVGNNISEYRWDGTDEYGDRLANGVYLYKVITRKVGGESYEKYNTGTGQYFKNGIGKLVIMR